VKLFDSHLHLTDSAFEEDRTAVLARARRAGVTAMVTVASDPDDARAALDLARRQTGVWCTAGLHPHDAHRWDATAREAISDLARQPKVVALGETGLDFHYDRSPRSTQAASFEAHLDLAAATGLPVVVHSRSADSEMIEFIARYSGRVRGVLHCFSGGAELLEAGLDAGWWISFAGMVTFRSFDGAELVRRVPAERLLIETDSPYLAPVPERGRRNEPAFVGHTCAAVAELRGAAPRDVARQSFDNACAVYGVTP